MIYERGFFMSAKQSYSQNGRKIIPYNRGSADHSSQRRKNLRKSRSSLTVREQQTIRLLLFGTGALAILAGVIFFIFYSRSRLVPYPIIENLAPESVLFEESAASLYKLPESLSEYEIRIDKNLSSLIPDYDCSESHISIFYYPNWEEKGDLGRITYTSKKHSALLCVSKTASPAPKELFSSEGKAVIGSTDVYFGYTQSPETFYAAWTDNQIYYCLSQQNVSHKSFSHLINTILA